MAFVTVCIAVVVPGLLAARAAQWLAGMLASEILGPVWGA